MLLAESTGPLHILHEDVLEQVCPSLSREEMINMSDEEYSEHISAWFARIPAFRKRFALWKLYVSKVIRQSLVLPEVFMEFQELAPQEWPFSPESEVCYGKTFACINTGLTWIKLLNDYNINFHEGDAQIGAHYDTEWVHQDAGVERELNDELNLIQAARRHFLTLNQNSIRQSTLNSQTGDEGQSDASMLRTQTEDEDQSVEAMDQDQPDTSSAHAEDEVQHDAQPDDDQSSDDNDDQPGMDEGWSTTFSSGSTPPTTSRTICAAKMTRG